MANQQEPDPILEPSVWDYFISKLRFSSRVPSPKKESQAKETFTSKPNFPWFTLVAILFGLVAQLTLEPSPNRTPLLGVIFYAIAFGCLLLAILKKEWQLVGLKPDARQSLLNLINLQFLIIGIVLAVLAFVLFGRGLFGFINTLLWLASIIFVLLAFLDNDKLSALSPKAIWERFSQEGWPCRVTYWTIVVLAVIAIILFFNFHRLESVPPEMISDHAEKVIDISTILDGTTPVFFPRNTGREMLQFYMTSVYLQVFNQDMSFLSLKVVSVFANLLTLFFIYLLGNEIGNKWTGLSSALFAGMAYWPLVITRIGLRFAYYPLFVAPLMYFFVRGLRRQKITDVLLAGLFLGLGLHGYTPYRIVPILVVIGILIYYCHKSAKGRRLEVVYVLFVIVLVSAIVFLPLLRYWLANPQLFSYRAFSRLTAMEVPFQKASVLIFLKNFWDASTMFFWDNGVIWVHSVPGRPALEFISGSFYFLGIIGLLVRYIRKRHWMDLFLLVSIPMLLMPSILSLAYPGENPSLNRSAGAFIPVFVVIGLSFEATVRSIYHGVSGKLGKLVIGLVFLLMLIFSGVNNHDLVFNQYYQLYRNSTWNTSELGGVSALFIDTMGSPETNYVVSYPHWVDTRLVALNAGYPGMDFEIQGDRLEDTLDDPRPILLFVNINDSENMNLLNNLFPEGVLWQYESSVANRDFMIFFVPPMPGGAQ